LALISAKAMAALISALAARSFLLDGE